MEISTENYGKVVICNQEDCKFRYSCSSHLSAGDFRSESGFRPELFLSDGKLICNTYDQPTIWSDMIHREDLPANHNSLDSGMVCWRDLIELVNDFQI
jgi:hypothetical protein